MRTRAATDERPEPRAKPKSGRRRKQTRCLCGITWNREFMAHGEGEGRRSVSACFQHATPGRVKARRAGRCVRTSSEAVRTRGQDCPGAASLALSALRLTTLAKTQGGASQRPSALAGPLFVCCCVGQAKVNGAAHNPYNCTAPNVYTTVSGVAPREAPFRSIDLGEVALRSLPT